jgi:hypothetical protein
MQVIALCPLLLLLEEEKRYAQLLSHPFVAKSATTWLTHTFNVVKKSAESPNVLLTRIHYIRAIQRKPRPDLLHDVVRSCSI